MKTYAEVITHEAEQMVDALLKGSSYASALTPVQTIGFIYEVSEIDVDIDIDEEFQRLCQQRVKFVMGQAKRK
jgi:hypothetical protein